MCRAEAKWKWIIYSFILCSILCKNQKSGLQHEPHSLNTKQVCWLCVMFPGAEWIFLLRNLTKRFRSNKALFRRPDFIVFSALCFSNQTNNRIASWICGKRYRSLTFLFMLCNLHLRTQIWNLSGSNTWETFQLFFIESLFCNVRWRENARRCKILLMISYTFTHWYEKEFFHFKLRVLILSPSLRLKS